MTSKLILFAVLILGVAWVMHRKLAMKLKKLPCPLPLANASEIKLFQNN